MAVTKPWMTRLNGQESYAMPRLKSALLTTHLLNEQWLMAWSEHGPTMYVHLHISRRTQALKDQGAENNFNY